MTLSVVFACPHNAPYKAVLSVQDRGTHPETFADVWREVQEHKVDPGHCVELYVTDTRRIIVTEERLPEILREA